MKKVRPITKRCGSCNRVKKVTTDFHRRGNGWQSICKSCRKDRDAVHYTANAMQRALQGVNQRLRVRAWMDELKESIPCADCGRFGRAIGMQWHHLPGYVKVANVSDLIKGGQRLKAEEEIKKCVLLCAYCHAVRGEDEQGLV